MGERVTAPEARGAQVAIGVPEEEEEGGGGGHGGGEFNQRSQGARSTRSHAPLEAMIKELLRRRCCRRRLLAIAERKPRQGSPPGI